VPPYEHPIGPIGEVERRIGEHIAELVPDGATIQLGIGAIPRRRRSRCATSGILGVHTEMFTDSIVDLVEAGVITGAARSATAARS
jgi:acyl-CoA hydrolase